MKQTLNTYEIANLLTQDTNANWSYKGALALAEYLQEMEEDTGEEMEFDVCAIRCDFAEYASLQEWAEDHSYEVDGADEMDDDEKDEAIHEFICDHGQLIEFDGGVIVSSF